MRHFVIVSCLFVSTLLSATITPTKTVAPIHEAVRHYDSNSLILFDIDNVLLTHSDMIFNLPEKERKPFIDRLAAHHTPDEMNRFESLVWLNSPEQLLDPRMKRLIHDVQCRQIPVIALTKAGTGQWGYIPCSEEFRADALKKVGIDFSPSFQNVKRISFDEFKVERPPVFTRGVLCTGKVSKGDTLRAFLKRTGFHPTRILFVDDLRENLTSVEEACQELGIAFEGFELTEVLETPILLDRELLEFQMRVLEQENRWLSDPEALHRMGR